MPLYRYPCRINKDGAKSFAKSEWSEDKILDVVSDLNS